MQGKSVQYRVDYNADLHRRPELDDDERKGVKKTAAATHCPVGLDPVLEAQSGALPDWLLLARVLGELEHERAERRMRLSLRQVALSLAANCCVGRERREEHSPECCLFGHPLSALRLCTWR